MSNNSITPYTNAPAKAPVSDINKMNMFTVPFAIASSVPNVLKVSEPKRSMMMVNFLVAPPKVTSAFTLYTDDKCTIADLIWWELEEVTE